MPNLESLELAGVPVLVRPPADPDLPAPLIVLWHGFGVPNSEEALAEVLPLEGVQAWKAYPGLPLFGRRLPAGGMNEIMRRQVEDYVQQLLLPVIEQALQELPDVVRALQARFGIDDQEGVGLFGFSAGGLAALLSLVESPLPITTAVLAGVTKDLGSAVSTFERGMRQYYPILKEQFPWLEERHTRYHWTKASKVAKQRLDFIAHAGEITQRQPTPALLLVHAVEDEAYPLEDVESLYAALASYYEQVNQPKQLSLQTFEQLGHQLDLEAARHSPGMQRDLAELQRAVAAWFSQHLLT